MSCSVCSCCRRRVIRTAEIVARQTTIYDAVLEVTVTNVGDLASNYITTVTDRAGIGIDAVPAQNRIIAPDESAVLYFDLHAPAGWGTGPHSIQVTLSSPTGRIYDIKDIGFTVD